MKILITGGAGFIGSHLVEALHRQHEVTVLDNLRTGHKKNLDNFQVNFVEGDIRNPELIAELTRDVEKIFHLAALVSVPESMLHPEETIQINTLGTLNILQAARKNKVPSVVLSSSSAVYGDSPEMPKREAMPPQPRSPYGISKLDGEYYLQMFRNEYNINATSLRYFNVFGPRQDPNSPYAAVIPIFIQKALQNEDIVIFGDGEQTRDFIFVNDVVAANLLVAEKGGDIFNVACGDTITINQLCQKIIKITGSTSKIIHAPERSGDITHSKADISRLRTKGWKAEADLDKGLEDTAQYFVNLLSD